jgi:hypothetical protein
MRRAGLMPSSRTLSTSMLLAPLLAVWLAALLTGCNSESATAGADVRTAVEGRRSGATSSAPATAQQPPRRGALTQAVPAAGNKPYDKTFDDIRFDMDPNAEFKRSMLTERIEALAGERIRIRGYIYPTPQQRGIKQFVLVRDNQQCCFGQGAALYDCILVEMLPGKSAEFSIRPVAVEGKFEIREIVGPDGRHLAIYHLDGETVQ